MQNINKCLNDCYHNLMKFERESNLCEYCLPSVDYKSNFAKSFLKGLKKYDIVEKKLLEDLYEKHIIHVVRSHHFNIFYFDFTFFKNIQQWTV
ncbi:hypothetical protein BW16_09110 [Bacillus pumilus]|nr:hypothetical protein BW16_09110 [Bacillus pumilus]